MPSPPWLEGLAKSRIGELNLKRNPAGDGRPESLDETSVRFRSGGKGKATTIGVNYTVAKWQKANEII